MIDQDLAPTVSPDKTSRGDVHKVEEKNVLDPTEQPSCKQVAGFKAWWKKTVAVYSAVHLPQITVLL